MIFTLVRTFAFLCRYINAVFGVNPRGLGFALRLLKEDKVICVDGLKLLLNHNVASAYARPVTGSWTEPETHVLLNCVISRLAGPVSFIDVGANIGEMVVDAARHKNVEKVFAFEPIPECCRAIRETLRLNGFSNCEIVEKLVGETPGIARFSDDGRNSGGSSLYSEASKTASREVPITTLDAELPVTVQHAILLIDIEGHEPAALKGGAGFIKANKPLIIFEYNFVSKQHFTLEGIKEILGPEYRFYRLRQDGLLDDVVENAWNCVAVPHASQFESILSKAGGRQVA